MSARTAASARDRSSESARIVDDAIARPSCTSRIEQKIPGPGLDLSPAAHDATGSTTPRPYIMSLPRDARAVAPHRRCRQRDPQQMKAMESRTIRRGVAGKPRRQRKPGRRCPRRAHYHAFPASRISVRIHAAPPGTRSAMATELVTLSVAQRCRRRRLRRDLDFAERIPARAPDVIDIESSENTPDGEPTD